MTMKAGPGATIIMIPISSTVVPTTATTTLRACLHHHSLDHLMARGNLRLRYLAGGGGGGLDSGRGGASMRRFYLSVKMRLKLSRLPFP